jgi:hypothetical protein
MTEHHLEVKADRDQAIPSQIRIDQLKMIDVYENAAKDDDVMKMFLVNLGNKINKALLSLRASELTKDLKE